ncbi:MAG: hypothetical protein ACTHKT_12665 [Solirubrobacterales bacterium]
MTGPWKAYTSQVYKRLRYLAAWTPGQEISPGDVGIFEDRSLEQQTTIAELGLELGVHQGNERRNRGLLSGVEIKPQFAAGAAAPVHPGVEAQAQFKIEFKATNGILLRAERSCEDHLDRIDLLREWMLDLYAKGKWEERQVVVTHVVKARALMVLVSEERGANATLTVGGSLRLDPTALAEGEGSVGLETTSGSVFQEVGEEMTPLYLALKVKDPALRRPRVKRANKRGRALPPEEGPTVIDVTF